MVSMCNPVSLSGEFSVKIEAVELESG